MSTKNVTIPASIAGHPCNINIDVVELELPLLLSKSTLKRTKTNLDLEHDKATMLGKAVELQVTTNGHYCVDISPNAEAFVTLGFEDNEIIKIHKQFGHASADNVIRLLRNGGKTVSKSETDKIRNVVSNCSV